MQPVVYLNGQYVLAREASIPAQDAGLLFGAGLFETIRAVDGVPRLFPRHLERLRGSCRELGVPFPLTGEEAHSIVSDLLQSNELATGEARVKILVTPGDTFAHYTHRDGTLLITVAPYIRPSLHIPWTLQLESDVMATAVTRHKTTSYFAYRVALHRARIAGCDDAVLLDRYGNVAECSVASLLLSEGDTMVFPASPDALPGITAAAVEEICADLGIATVHRPISTAELLGGSPVLVCNALLGPFPVAKIGATTLSVMDDGQLKALRDAWESIP